MGNVRRTTLKEKDEKQNNKVKWNYKLKEKIFELYKYILYSILSKIYY